MFVENNHLFPTYFSRDAVIQSLENLLHSEIVRRDAFEKRYDDGTAPCRFCVDWLQLANGKIIATVRHAELVPLLNEVLDALKAHNV